MIHYILQVLTFQLIFIVLYDFFLKRETFFNLNRSYLLITPLISFLIPFIKFEILSNVFPKEYIIALPEVIVGTTTEPNFLEATSNAETPLWQYVMYIGSAISLLIFCIKLFKIYQLKRNNETIIHRDYIKIILKKSTAAFSFLWYVFLGDKIVKKNHSHIIEHELVHVKQYHSLDLIFYELLKIIMWFNPLIYIYQNRITALHEFIADAKVAKEDKHHHYQLLLSEVFKTEKISFINQFFKSSLIKKRIVMLQKSKSKNIWQLKYLFLAPLVLSMLIYSSCENENGSVAENEIQEFSPNEQLIVLREQLEKGELNTTEKEKLYLELLKLTESMKIEYSKETEQLKETVIVGYENSNTNKNDITEFPFSVVDEAPIFPGCENAEDPRACFNEKVQEHIRKNFNYPKKAQELGIQGRVSVLFTIGEEGNIINIRMRGPDKTLEREARRIIEKLPKMLPGKQKGKAVKVPFSIPINFRLQ